MQIICIIFHRFCCIVAFLLYKKGGDAPILWTENEGDEEKNHPILTDWVENRYENI